MIKILKKTYQSSTFDLNEVSGQVEETTLTPLSPSAAFELEPIAGDASYTKDSANPIVFYIDESGYLVTASNVRAAATKLQYSGTFMDIPSLSVTVKSPALIQWEIGDYIVWDYDGQTYTLRNIPQVKKQARTNTYGEAFVYENMQFVSVLSELKNLDFLDVVLSSTPSHFTTLPIFSFFGNCYALIDRINANLGRLYANWEVKAANVVSGDIYDALYTEREVNIDSPIKVWDAIALFYSMWGLGFVYSYNESTNKHNLTVGATGGETGNFEYGQGSGLRMITTSIAKEDNIVTRLRAYGSTRNMPSRYYNNKVILIDRLLFTDPLVYLPNLMIPYWKWDVTNGDPRDAYIDCDNPHVDDYDTSFEKYGIREASIFFDGTGDLEEIYPTIERITAKEVRDAIAALQYESAEYPLYHSPSAVIYPDTERLDLVKVGDTLDDIGIVITTDIYKETVSFAGGAANYPTTTEQFTIQLDPMYSQTLTKDGDYKATLGSQTIGLSGVDTDILSARLKMWLTLNGTKSVLLKTIDGEISMGATTFTLPDFTFSAQEQGDTYAIEISIDITTPAIIEEGIANVNCAISSGSLTYELVKSTPIRNFSITLKQIGFDIKRFLPNAGQSPVISMTSGACQGREFIVKETTYNPVTDDWTLLCARQADTSIGNQWFPNVNFHIAQGDSFVILNTSMPEFLINVAEERLYIAACNWLRKNKEPKFVYEPQIDNVYMAYNSQLIKEGMMMPLSDTDLGISGSKLINSVTITENEESIRTFNVVLKEDIDKDLLRYINESARRESSSVVGNITNAKTSKTESAELPSGGISTSTISADGKADLNGDISQDFSAKKLTLAGSITGATTVMMEENINKLLRLPKLVPTSATADEYYLYATDSGFSGELPSGAGSVDSVALVSNLTGISVTGSPITTSGTFTLNFVSGYSIPTNYKQGEWDNAYALRHNAVTLGTANGLSLSTQVLSLGLASASTNGALSSTDWSTFNGKEPAIGTKGTAFNKNFGTTAGTVLEGRTFGSAAAAATTDFLAANGKAADSELLDNHNSDYFATATGGSGYIQNQNASAQSANMWINGHIKVQNSTGIGEFYQYSGNITILSIAGATASQSLLITDNALASIAQFKGDKTSRFIGAATFDSSITMLENINTNLRIPKVAPTSPTSGEYYFYIVE